MLSKVWRYIILFVLVVVALSLIRGMGASQWITIPLALAAGWYSPDMVNWWEAQAMERTNNDDGEL